MKKLEAVLAGALRRELAANDKLCAKFVKPPQNLKCKKCLTTFSCPSQLKKLEAVLAGALRRELAAANKAQRLAADIAVVERLSRQHEHAASCSKMVVKFREDRIKRLEALSKDVLPVDEYYQQVRAPGTGPLRFGGLVE